jgi:4,5-DOPA dioxygenase extradiol
MGRNTLQPVIFFGHGSPMNALEDNRYTRAWSALGAAAGGPRAILAISAHWYLPGTRVTAMIDPPTIHDFGGFPKALFDMQYPAPGDPDLARRVVQLLAPTPVALDRDWGLDHGVWSVLCHAFPRADVPVIQLSIDATQPAAYHYDLAKRLAPLREEDVLIIGTGNIVHNLRAFLRAGVAVPSQASAMRFDTEIRQALEAGDHDAVIHYECFGEDARWSVPTVEHYLPLLYVIAQQRMDEDISFPVSGIEGGAISMLSVKVG